MDNNRGRGNGNSNRGQYNRGRGNNNGSKPNYKQLNMQTLTGFFGKHLDEETIWSIFQDNNFDLDRTINELSQLTGVKVAEEEPDDGCTYVTEKKGDLFACDVTHSLAHCVSRDLRMGKGIAVEFKNRFQKVDELKSQNKQIGEAAILGPLNQNRYVYYLITKENYWNKPTYDDLRKSVTNMKNHAIVSNVKFISMPRLGCGLDGLLWPQVKKMLKEEFKNTGISVTVYSL